MSKVYISVAACAVVLISSLCFLWFNILVLDDFHPAQKETIQELEEVNQDNIADAPSEPQEKKPDTKDNLSRKGYHIHINLDELVMYVYKDGELLRTYPVSGGSRRTPSPVGTWRVISKDTWGEGFGGAWLGFNVPWGKYGIHGTVYPWLIGKSNSSKGCIRMNNKDVKELYKLVPHGTTVTIIHDNKPFRAMKSGDIGSDVLEIQRALKKLGYYHGGTDGKFGSGLKQSVIKFQKSNKIYSNGIVSKQTYEAIIQRLKSMESDLLDAHKIKRTNTI